MPEVATSAPPIDAGALNLYVDRVLRLHEERTTLNNDIAAVYKEAKSAGFVTAIVRQMVTEKRMEGEERDAHYRLCESYRIALGMLADTPLGQAAMREHRLEPDGSVTVRPYPSKPFAEQPMGRRRGRPRKNGHGLQIMDGPDAA